jgi:hypothetical protein
VTRQSNLPDPIVRKIGPPQPLLGASFRTRPRLRRSFAAVTAVAVALVAEACVAAAAVAATAAAPLLLLLAVVVIGSASCCSLTS